METRKIYGGIYIDKSFNSVEEATEFGVYLGHDQTTWFGKDEHVYEFDQLIEKGGIHNLQYIDGYSFGIHKGDTPETRTWHVRDTGHKCCKHILFKGTYEDDDFVKGVEKFIGQMTGTGKSFQTPKKVEKPVKVKPQLSLFL